MVIKKSTSTRVVKAIFCGTPEKLLEISESSIRSLQRELSCQYYGLDRLSIAYLERCLSLGYVHQEIIDICAIKLHLVDIESTPNTPNALADIYYEFDPIRMAIRSKQFILSTLLRYPIKNDELIQLQYSIFYDKHKLLRRAMLENFSLDIGYASDLLFINSVGDITSDTVIVPGYPGCRRILLHDLFYRVPWRNQLHLIPIPDIKLL